MVFNLYFLYDLDINAVASEENWKVGGGGRLIKILDKQKKNVLGYGNI